MGTVSHDSPSLAPGTAEPDPRRWRALAVLAAMQLMLVLDVTVVNVALPRIQHDLSFSHAGLAWVVSGYVLMAGGFLLLGGRLADLFGRRRLFLVGVIVFGAASAACGAAVSSSMLVASRARRRVKGAGMPAPDPDLARQRQVVDAFIAAARRGDFDALVAVLHPDVVGRADYGARRPAASVVTRGAEAVARQALLGGAIPAARLHPALVNGSAGVVVTLRGQPFALMSFTVADGKITEIDTIADPERVRTIAAAFLTAGQKGPA